MAATQIVCTNCGAKYRIPETFKGSRAKCKACGTVIDVAAQRAAATADESVEQESAPTAAKPAAAKPASARPAATRKSSSRSARDSASPARPSRSRRPGKDSEEAGGDETKRGSRSHRVSSSSTAGKSGSRRRGRAAPEEKKSNKGLLIGGGVLVLAVAVVGIVFFMGGDDEPAIDPLASDATDTPPANQVEDQATDTEGQVTEAAAADPEEVAPVEGAADAKTDDPEAADANEEESTAPETKVESKPARKKGEPITDPSQVFNPMTDLEPMPWPEDVTDEERAIIEELISDLANGGRPGITAKKKLEALGYKPLPAIFNALREKDYMDSFDSMDAWELNKFMETTTKGANMPFRSVNVGDEVPLETADWNARIVKGWVSFVSHYSNQENWDLLMEKRGKK